MEQRYDFDREIDRRGTGSVMYDRCTEMFGRDDLLPLWVADMGFAACPDITQALAERITGHPIYGYSVIAIKNGRGWVAGSLLGL